MKKQGLVKRIDPLGRIVIPSELRKMLDVCPGDSIELVINTNGVVELKKHDSGSGIKNKVEDLEKYIFKNNTDSALNPKIKIHLDAIKKLIK